MDQWVAFLRETAGSQSGNGLFRRLRPGRTITGDAHFGSSSMAGSKVCRAERKWTTLQLTAFGWWADVDEERIKDNSGWLVGWRKEKTVFQAYMV